MTLARPSPKSWTKFDKTEIETVTDIVIICIAIYIYIIPVVPWPTQTTYANNPRARVGACV